MSSVTEPLLTPEIIALARAAHEVMSFKDLWFQAKTDLKNYGYDELLAEFIAFGYVSKRRASLLHRYVALMSDIVDALENQKPRSHDEAWAAEEEAQLLRDNIEPATMWAEVYTKRYPETGSL
jgi:hypothetical protein